MSIKSIKKIAGLYIHIPFCEFKCMYCDFYSASDKETLIPEFVKALIKEIEQCQVIGCFKLFGQWTRYGFERRAWRYSVDGKGFRYHECYTDGNRSGDVEVKRVEREGFAAQTVELETQGEQLHVSLVLDMNDSPALLSKGMARDIVRRVQAKRKDLNLEIEATIDLEVWLKNAPDMHAEDETWVATETRSAGCVFHPEGANPPADAEHFEVDGATVHFTVK